MDEDKVRHYLQQTEEIVWNKYPQLKPEETGFYLVTFEADDVEPSIAYFNKIHIDFKWSINGVAAWAFLPKGYTEET